MVSILKVICFLFWLPMHLILVAFTYVKGWEWFIVPLGTPQINMLHAIGLGIVLKMLTSDFSQRKRESGTGMVERAAVASITYALILLILWIIQSFM